MNIENYRKIENEINEEYKLKIHRLRNEYVESNKKFNIGDFVFNVTGIIKVDKIGHEKFFNNIEIVYTGYRYRKVKGEFIRTKGNKISSMYESHELKLMEK